MRRHPAICFVLAASCAFLGLVGQALAAAPAVTIDPSPTASYTSVEVSGEVEPEDHETYWEFQYSKDPGTEGWTFGAFGGPLPVGATPAEKSISAEITGLQPGTEYEVRLVANNFIDPESISAEPNPTFTTLAVGPPDVQIDEVTTFTGTTAHFSGTIDPEAPVGDPPAFDVEWHFECTPTCPGLGEVKTVKAEEGSQEVEADAEGLKPNTDYEVTLVASNKGAEVTAGPKLFKTDGVAPVVQTLYAGPIGATTAVLAANVNPRNAAVTYRFEWGSDESYGNFAPPSPTALGVGDDVLHSVTASIADLQQGTTYHFRVLATNTETAETSEGADHVFTTLEPLGPPAPCANAAIREAQGSTDLPDCRAYEQVSPQDKNGYDVTGWGVRSASTSGGNALFATRGTAPGASSGGITPLVASRDSQKWSSRAIDAPSPSGSPASLLAGVSDDLSRSVVRTHATLTPAAAAGVAHLYLRDNAGSDYTLLSPLAPLPNILNPFLFNFDYAGASDDFSHVVYDASDAPQTTDPAPGTFQSYEWINGDVRLVGVLPNGEPAPFGARVGSSVTNGSVDGAVARDGSRIVFHAIEASAAPFNTVAGQLYVRDSSNPGPPQTLHASASQRTDCAADPSCGGDGVADPLPDPAGPLPALFWAAERDHGAKVLFSSCEKLTDDATASTVEDSAAGDPQCARGDQASNYTVADTLPHGNDLYVFDVPNDELVDLTPQDPNGANVLGVVGTSDSLNTVYFVALGVLANGAIHGKPNLYVWQHGETKFIATLDDTPHPLSPSPFVSDIIDFNNWSRYTLRDKLTTSRVTPDGEHLVITSRLPLTGYDNSCPARYTGRCSEVYLYDATAAKLTCVSCGTGSDATNDAMLFHEGGAPGAQGSPDPLPANLSADGKRVFFETRNQLSSGDSDGRIDVYEWEEGAIRLISEGGAVGDSYFADADPNGANVFFTTRDQLAGSDRDTLDDLYDARINGGFVEPGQPPSCLGDGCQGEPQGAPSSVGPTTSAFHGPDNVKERKPRCGKGKVSRKGKCVNKKAATKKAKHRANDKRRASR